MESELIYSNQGNIIQGPLLLMPSIFKDERGYFLESWNQNVFNKSKIHFQMSAAQNEIFNENDWWTSDQGISAYILESVKYPIYFFSSKNFNYIRND